MFDYGINNENNELNFGWFEKNGLTVLIYASQNGRKDIIEMLLKTPKIDIELKRNVFYCFICNKFEWKYVWLYDYHQFQ